jgi:hypothetical protein
MGSVPGIRRAPPSKPSDGGESAPGSHCTGTSPLRVSPRATPGPTRSHPQTRVPENSRTLDKVQSSHAGRPIRVYHCRTCDRRFTPGPRALRNKTYPLGEILEVLTAYNQGHSLEDAARRLSSRHGHAINPATISRWLPAHSGRGWLESRSNRFVLFYVAVVAQVGRGEHPERSLWTCVPSGFRRPMASRGGESDSCPVVEGVVLRGRSRCGTEPWPLP